MKTTEEILKTEFSEEFVRLMKNRMITSHYKYGSIGKNYGKYIVDRVASLEKRVEMYKETGNTEWLVDAANFAMIEFILPRHKKAHFEATDSNESPGLEWTAMEEKK